MNRFDSYPAERRQNRRIAIQQQARIRLTLDGASADGESIEGVTLTDISQEGLMASNAGGLVPGAQIILEVPLVGWREAEVMWIADNRAGCRFTSPLSIDELGMAAASSHRLAAECPQLASTIADIVRAEDADHLHIDASSPVEQQLSSEGVGRGWLWISAGLFVALFVLTLLAIG
jgi:hypothetical protein